MRLQEISKLATELKVALEDCRVCRDSGLPEKMCCCEIPRPECIFPEECPSAGFLLPALAAALQRSADRNANRLGFALSLRRAKPEGPPLFSSSLPRQDHS